MNEEERKTAVEKMKTCLKCEHFIKFTRQCKLCGCFMPVKVLIPGQKCPDGKW